MSQDREAMLYGLGAVALWSTVATAFKLALEQMSPLELVWLAALVSWLLIGVLMWRQGKLREALTTGWRGGWRTALWAGLMNPVGYYLVLFGAYARLPGQEAMALNYTWALAMAFLAVPILAQRLTRIDVAAGLIAYAGVWTIATRGEIFDVAFADPLVAQWQNFSIALPVLTLLVAFGPGFGNFIGASANPQALTAGIYVGLCEMGIAFVLWQLAVHKVSRTAKVSNLIFLSPPISLTLLHFIVGEPILTSTLAGLVLILAGLGLQQLQKAPAELSQST